MKTVIVIIAAVSLVAVAGFTRALSLRVAEAEKSTAVLRQQMGVVREQVSAFRADLQNVSSKLLSLEGADKMQMEIMLKRTGDALPEPLRRHTSRQVNESHDRAQRMWLGAATVELNQGEDFGYIGGTPSALAIRVLKTETAPLNGTRLTLAIINQLAQPLDCGRFNIQCGPPKPKNNSRSEAARASSVEEENKIIELANDEYVRWVSVRGIEIPEKLIPGGSSAYAQIVIPIAPDKISYMSVFFPSLTSPNY